MKYLLDSHILIWALFMEEKLPGRVRDIINQPENEIYYSPASVWEIGLKHQKAPEKMPVSGELLMECCEKAGMASLPIVKEHTIAVNRLQRRENEPPHNDPFDRMLLAQARVENLIFITHDHLLDGYGESCVMIV